MAGERAAIFDLDQTLVDSGAIEPLRRARNWRRVYAAVPDLRCYDGVAELLEELRTSDIRLAIVTSSPESYCSKVLQVCGVRVDACVCYHDTKFHKPHPEPLLLALERLGGVKAANAVAIGDVAADIIAARSAEIYSIAATWGCGDVTTLKGAEPDGIAANVSELRSALFVRFGINP